MVTFTSVGRRSSLRFKFDILKFHFVGFEYDEFYLTDVLCQLLKLVLGFWFTSSCFSVWNHFSKNMRISVTK